MKKMINKVHLEGYLYEHTLELKKSGPNSKKPGTEYIAGEIKIATDNAMTNIIPVHFSYVTEMTGGGKPNATFTTLKNIVDGNIGAYMKVGDKAGKLKIDTAIALNEFFSDKINPGNLELVSTKRYEGGFVHAVDVIEEDEKLRNTFECDMLINGAVRKEGDPDKNTVDKVVIKGAIFDFRNALLPIEFSVLNPAAMDYFESLELNPNTNPLFTKLFGRQVSEIVIKKTVEESAWGEDIVKESKSTRKDFIITNASRVPYEFGEEGVLTVDEVNEAIKNREMYLATLKQKREEYNASKAAPAAAAAVPTAGTFNF